MEWMECLKSAIDYMEAHLLEDISGEDVAKNVHISYFYLQKGFRIMTDYSISEYIRNRRLYLAALDLIADDEKIIDIAYKYGYDTPESFTKAFGRFHGATPAQIRKERNGIKNFLPLKINVSMQGGADMDYRIEKLPSMKFIGVDKITSYEKSYVEIPEFWNEYRKSGLDLKYLSRVNEQNLSEVQKILYNNQIGEFGICVYDESIYSRFTYFIAGKYMGGAIPKGMKVFEIPELTWVVFKCVGPMPGAIQSVTTEIFKQWLPRNKDYELDYRTHNGFNVEHYPQGDSSAIDYESEIWIPVRKK